MPGYVPKGARIRVRWLSAKPIGSKENHDE